MANLTINMSSFCPKIVSHTLVFPSKQETVWSHCKTNTAL